MVTLLPNWQTRVPNIGEEGFLTLDSVKAGDTYYKPDLITSGVYKQDGQYFISFTQIPDVVERLEYKF